MTPNQGDYIWIHLTPNEVAAAANHATIRRLGHLNGASKDRHRLPERDSRRDDLDNDVQSCAAELAFAKYIGEYWGGITEKWAPDTKWGEVRWVRENHHGLIINPDDDDRRRFVLMDGFAPDFRIVGWMYGYEAKQKGQWTQDTYWLAPRCDIWKFKARTYQEEKER